MLQLRTVSFILLSAVLCSCGGKSQGEAGTPKGSAATPNAAATPNETASTDSEGFTAVIDGNAVSGKKMHDYDPMNVAVRSTSDYGPSISFKLADSTKNSRNEPNHTIWMIFPDAVTNATVTPQSSEAEQAKYSITVYINTDPQHYAVYIPEDIKFAVTSLSKTKVIGTFSGKFELSEQTPRVEKKEITVTDGRFNIPFATNQPTP